VAERLYRLGASERDRLIVELYEKGWSMRAIARRVGMSASGVCRALERVERGAPGVDRRAE
jgi:lambda repressor-like predicted transcriptional regulator